MVREWAAVAIASESAVSAGWRRPLMVAVAIVRAAGMPLAGTDLIVGLERSARKRVSMAPSPALANVIPTLGSEVSIAMRGVKPASAHSSSNRVRKSLGRALPADAPADPAILASIASRYGLQLAAEAGQA